MQFFRLRGKYRPACWRARNWLARRTFSAPGRPHLLLFNEVINKQIKARRALADSEARFRVTFENAAVGIAHLGLDLRWLRADEALCRILGYRSMNSSPSRGTHRSARKEHS
jgi:PAS domain-containing protein